LTPAFTRIEAAIKKAFKGEYPPGEKIGTSLERAVGEALTSEGFRVDYQDRSGFLGYGLPVWRDKNSGEVELTNGRRRIDIVVYDNDNRSVALVETESDLNDLKRSGVTNRNGHYDVFSIARDSTGEHFHSYKSLERMAAAAFYRWTREVRGAEESEMKQMLEKLSSDDPAAHNLLGLGLFLVTGYCRPTDREILAPRLGNLNASLLFRRG